MLENTTLIGNLGGDPTMRYLADGTPVTNFSVAVNKRRRLDNGEYAEVTKWFRVAAFGNQAEACYQYLRKGRQVYVEGTVTASAWIDQNTGEARSSLELRARRVKFLGTRADADADLNQVDADHEPVEEEQDLPF